MSAWEKLQNYIRATNGQPFDAWTLAADLGITTREASAMIQSHLNAQRSANSMTQYVIHRIGRTRAAVWHPGDRALDAKELSRQTLDDMTVRVAAALEPDLLRMGVTNPRVRQLATALVGAFEASLQLLTASLP